MGRFLALDCTVNDSQYILVNLYAPTKDKILEQEAFRKYVYAKLEPYLGHPIVIGGDLNICLDNRSKAVRNANMTYLDCIKNSCITWI